MKLFGILFLYILITFTLYPQSKVIQGVVVDARYKTPVAYAAVFLQHTTFGTVADNVGKFTFTAPDSLQNGNLVISCEGFEIKYLSLENIETSGLKIGLQSTNHNDDAAAMLDKLRQHPKPPVRFLANAVKLVLDDWVPLGNAETNAFDFGRIQTIPTLNPIEGVRLRAGLASNARLSPHFFVRGYAAYGFKDKKVKYRGEAVYSFNKKAYHEDEFPKNNLRLTLEHDLYSPGEMHPRAQNDLLLVTYRRSVDQSTYRNFAEINYEREYKNGFSHTFWLRKSTLVPQGSLSFGNQNSLTTSETGVTLRYSVKEAYVQQKRKRTALEMTSPVFFLSHSVGLKDFWGGEAAYHRTEFSVQKRFLLGNIGRLDAVGEAMKVWNAVPFPLLVYPNQRYRHHIENNAFYLNRALEFVADEQYTVRAVFVGDDFLLSKSPFLEKWGAKELLSFRASYGRLSDKNDPSRSPSAIYDFPAVSYRYDAIPYIEATIGLTNILGILRVEYVHRFTYRDHVGASLGGIRADITL